ncbi:MAG: PEGA domain-containing protein [Candidatus Paceibacterota bacterium]|jgi:hypothetical protein
MTKKTRTIIFLICFVIFAIGGPSVILYSQGYRINLNAQDGEKIITSTGGIFIKTLPKQVDVSLNGKVVKKTDFLFGSVLIENLLPGKYEVEVSKEGYAPWKKILAVKEKEVTEAKSIILFPAEISFGLISENTERVWPTLDQRIIIEKENAEGWILNMYDPELDTETNLLREKDIYSKEVELKDITFSTTSSEVILETEILGKDRYFSFSLDNVKGTIENIQNPGEVAENHLYGNYTFQYAEEILSAKSAGFEDREIATGVKDIKLSPDGKKLLYFTQNEISIFFLEDSIVPRKDAGEIMTLMASQDGIIDCLWINSEYIAISTNGEILIAELDDRDNLQTITLAVNKNPDMIWNDFAKRLYYNSQEGLFASDVFLP